VKRNVVAMARRDRTVNVELEIELLDLHVAFVVVYNVHGVDVGSVVTVVDLSDTSDDVSVHLLSEKIVDDHYCSAADCIDTDVDGH